MRKNIIYTLTVLILSIPINIASQEPFELCRERLYLQTDKQEYIPGELVWIKAISTNEKGVPISFSKIAYIELLENSDPKAQIKLELTNGSGDGWIQLPSDLPSGKYKLLGYTRYMKNEGDDIFFKKNITIINPDGISDTEMLQEEISTSILYNESDLGITLTTNKQEYSKREKVLLQINKIPQNVHTLSISIIGEQPLTSEKKANLITWNKLITNQKKTIFQPQYIPEYEGHIIEAKLINKVTGNGQYYAGVTPIIVFPGEDIRISIGRIDKTGNILFPTKETTGVEEILSTLLNYTKENFLLEFKSPFIRHDYKNVKTSITKNINHKIYKDRLVALQLQNAFIKDSINRFEVHTSSLYPKPDKSYKLDNYKRFTTMQEVIGEFIDLVYFRDIEDKLFLVLYQENEGITQGNTLVLVDGIPIFDHKVIYDYDPLLVEKVDIYYDKFIFGSMQFKGIISFTTYNKNYPNLKLDSSTKIFSYPGVQNKRLFYMPTYETAEAYNSRIPDFRHTLYWNPNVETKNGQNLENAIYTSDQTGSYTITIEGLTDDGKVIFSESKFQVK